MVIVELQFIMLAGLGYMKQYNWIWQFSHRYFRI